MKKVDELIDQVLKTEPTFKLSDGFKERVLKSIRKKDRRSQRILFALMGLGVIIIFGFGVSLLAYFQNLEALSSFKNIVPIAVLIGGVVAMIQYLDNKLVKKKMFTQEFS